MELVKQIRIHQKKGMIFLLAIACLFSLLSLASYDYRDYQNLHFGKKDAPVYNWGGRVGVAIANLLYFWLGMGSYLLLLLAFSLPVVWGKGGTVRYIGIFTAFLLWFLFVLSFLETVPIHSNKMVSYGGVIGIAVVSKVQNYVGETTCAIFLLTSLGFLVWEVFNIVEKYQEEKREKMDVRTT